MVQSKEYVLERLDQWYSNRVREKYTDEVANEVIKQIYESAKKKGEFKLSLEFILSEVLKNIIWSSFKN